jgi:hypothetical protein
MLVPDNYALVLLRIGPYSPMYNPIENCFSVFMDQTACALSRPMLLYLGKRKTDDDVGDKHICLLDRVAHGA